MTSNQAFRNTVHVSSDGSRKALLFALIAVVCWSLGAYLFCLVKRVPVLQLLAMCQILGGAFSLLFERKETLFKNARVHLLKGWGFVFLLLTNLIGYVVAFRIAPAAQVDLIHYLWPTFVVVGGICRGRSRITRNQLLGISFCLISLVVVMAPELKEASFSLTHLAGYVIAFIAASSWALYNLIRGGEKNTTPIGFDILRVGLLCAVGQTLFGKWVSLSGSEWMIVLLIGLLCHGIAFPFWRKALSGGKHATLGGIANAIPILSISWLVLGSVVSFSFSLCIAFALVTAGCALLQKRQVREVSSRPPSRLPVLFNTRPRRLPPIRLPSPSRI